LPPTAASTSPEDSPKPNGKSPLIRPYLGYVGYFVGAGAISGGVVHYPLNPPYYTALVIAGATLFLAATILNEVVLSTATISRRRLIRLVGASLLLSFGIGMLSGGIQHFTDFPARAATLIPLGIALSFGAYVLRNGVGGRQRRLAVFGAAILAVSAISYFALQLLAERLSGASHSHNAVGLFTLI
jgi:hypothetical protein